jgi:hypothetical protein
MRCLLFSLSILCLAGCGGPSHWWGHDHEAAPVPEREVTSVQDDPVTVVLMDTVTHNDLWRVETTRSHIVFLPDTGTIKIDGQTWSGPYKIVKR